MEQLREQGVEDVTRVKTACLEGDGKISVIRDEEDRPPQKREDPSRR
jgi:uncharacterized membrane protein YcaP (DUF421 family)